MWMMGYNDSGDSFNGRKLRPLIPRPLPNSTTTAINNNPSRIHGTDFFGLNDHLGTNNRSSFFFNSSFFFAKFLCVYIFYERISFW